MENMGLKDYSAEYDLHMSDEVINNVDEFVKSLPGGKKIVINPFTADPRRDMSLSQLDELIGKIKVNWPGCVVIIIGDPSAIKKVKNRDAIISPFSSLASSCRIVFLADIVISPDTSIVHIAAAWRKPMVSLYGHDVHGKYINSILWAPGYPEATQLFTKDKHHPVSSIDVDEIIEVVWEKI